MAGLVKTFKSPCSLWRNETLMRSMPAKGWPMLNGDALVVHLDCVFADLGGSSAHPDAQ